VFSTSFRIAPQAAIDWFERKAKIKVEPGPRRSILQSTKAAQQ
jgi:hypothetical protein